LIVMAVVRVCAALAVLIALVVVPTQASASAGLTIQLSDDSRQFATAGSDVTWTVQVRNTGDQTAVNVAVEVTLASAVERATWTASYTDGADGPVIGAAAPDTRVTLPAGSAAVFTIVASLSSQATGDAVTTANVEYDGEVIAATDLVKIVPSSVIVGDSWAGDGAPTDGATRARRGVAPVVRLLDPTSSDLITAFQPYEPAYRGGVHAVLGDLDGDGWPEIITAPGKGRIAEVRVFRVDVSDASDPTVLRDATLTLQPFGPRYRDGLVMTSGDFDGDGLFDIAVARASGAGDVRVFVSTPTTAAPFRSYRSFRPGIAFGSAGIALAAADFGTFDEDSATPGLADGRAELVVAGGTGSSTRVQIRDASRGAVPVLDVVSNVAPRQGLHVSVARVSRDSVPDLIIAHRDGTRARVTVLDGVVNSRPNAVLATVSIGRTRPTVPVFAAGVDTDGDGWADAIQAAWWGERSPKASRHDIVRDLASPTGLIKRATSITLGPGTVNSAATHGRVATFTSPASAIVTTESGLQYRDVVVGTGTKPSGPAATVVVNYQGWLLDGTEVEQGTAASVALNDTIRGWAEGLATMKVGGRRQLIIPADLAYGAAGTGNIPPNSTLVFDIELLSTT
jgi:uncharacterized repeat protein (TIGR01451 family)